MRLFISVDCGAAVRTAAAALIGELKACDADVKWVEPENLHLTLSFLGEADGSRLPGIEKAMAEAAEDFPPFELCFDRLGSFGSATRPRVLWIGAGAGGDRLAALAGKLRAALKAHGVAPAEDFREFSAHLTLGRVRGPRELKRLVLRYAQARLPAGLKTTVDLLTLYQSRLSSKGPAYKLVASRPLAATRTT